ncbi:YqcC family protein [Azotobacter salinestris]|uniref:YqcC family protein n=1 Tax=Azotobacter salinestris TaxID=69964 RepID=UPI0032DF30C6
MDVRIPALAEQMLLIERELRILGMWGLLPPSDEALSSGQPFCVDTLAFEEWLQWIFLPRMKVIIEGGRALPASSGIRPMAEMVYRERLAEVAALLEALGEIDRLISGGGLTVAG